METTDFIHVSVIVPIYNGSLWIDKCFNAILNQTAKSRIYFEVCVCNDASTDNTKQLLEKWKEIFKKNEIDLRMCENKTGTPKGVGYSKNCAVNISRGKYLCFQDVDDVMLPDRILKQYNFATTLPDSVLTGCKFTRDPVNSTIRYTKWANSLTQQQLNVQVYTSHGPTIIMPTWFCHRNVYDRIGGFSEDGRGTPEDLIFFYKHLDLEGTISRTDETLLVYQYHPSATTFSIDEHTIWNLRLKRLETIILSKWKQFTIWNAGKQGRKFYKSLSKENQNKVLAFCDVDINKIGKQYIPFDERTRTSGRSIPIVNYKQAEKPFVICVKQDMTLGQFEANLKSLQLIENADYIFFS